MAIYHFSAQIIGRSSGRSAVAASAYRAGERLHDERLNRDHDFTNKSGVVHSEVMLPEGAPEHLSDRERLWNDVEAFEKRRDAQLAREVEVAIPRELNQQQGIELAREFVQAEFVDRGMIADLNVHWDIGADGLAKPHAHVMLTMREVGREVGREIGHDGAVGNGFGENGEAGFGAKVREWNSTALVERWRERWADHVNARLAELDIDARVDHRSLEAQGIAHEPQHKIGPAASRMEDRGHASERLAEHHAIARSNGEKILADPAIAIDAITHGQATFTSRDLALFAHRHSEGKEQFDSVMAAMRGSDELVRLGRDGRGEQRFTSRAMLESEARLELASVRLDARRGHGVDAPHQERALASARSRGLELTSEQHSAFAHVTGSRDLSSVVGYAGSGKSAMLGVAREAWEAAGYQVRGLALSGIAAEGLENGSGIASRTIAAQEHQWGQGRDLLTSRDVLVIDEAGMVGTRQIERVLTHAAQAGAKVVLVGDPQQLQAIEAGAAFRAIAERHGNVEITEVRRQHEDWQREATRQLATGRATEALGAYQEAGHVHAAATREAARGDLIDRWDRERQARPGDTRIILAHTNDDVRALNEAARERMRLGGDPAAGPGHGLGEDVTVMTERGERNFASGDRVMFLKNERSLGVKNGTLGTVEQVISQTMTVRTDDRRSHAFDTRDYAHIDHGYAATVHKAQGMTVERVHVLATPGMDSHSAYVALSRHRTSVELHYGRDDFADQSKLVRTLSRERGKDMASDYPPTRERAMPAPEQAGHIPAQGADPGHDARVSEAALRRARTDALIRHARAVDAIFTGQEIGMDASRAQLDELHQSRRSFEALRPFGSKDAEAAYLKDPALAREAGQGRLNRAVTALYAETELRTAPSLRADQFIARWNDLADLAERQYVSGSMSNHRATRSAMAAMARGLERDPQLESLLAGRKAQLGITFETGSSLGRDLALSHGLDLGRGRGLGI